MANEAISKQTRRGAGTADRAYLQAARLMARLVGLSVRIARLRRGWSEAALAERAVISRATLQKIERGDPTVALGLALEACAILGITPFGTPLGELREALDRAQLELAALPKRIRSPGPAVDDDF